MFSIILIIVEGIYSVNKIKIVLSKNHLNFYKNQMILGFKLNNKEINLISFKILFKDE